jgi:hypothetical protein
MPLIQLVVVLVVVGVILWVVNNYIPMQSTMKSILNAIVIIAVILWLLSVFGIISSLQGIRIGIAIIVSSLFIFAFTACEKKGTAEKAGEKVDQAVEKIGEKIEDAKEAISDNAEKAGEEIDQAAEKAGEKI